VRCDEVARILPEAVDNGAAVELSVQRHIDSCLRCQAELARYRRVFDVGEQAALPVAV